QTSLFGATDAAGIPDAIAVQMAEVFSGDVDFYRDLRRGDRFSIMYEALEADGEFVRPGRILAAEFVNQGRVLRAVYFEDPNGRGSYYTPDGRNMRRAFLRSPLEFSRITSGFTTARFHPILQKWRAHKGIDYAAPVGTPVRATADAVAATVGHQKGYGNVIVLRHANSIQTVYAHLSGFRRDLRAGTRVQQGEVIGYVGMTGLATGPHLHYEFHVNGLHVDPLRSAPQPGPPITAQLRPAFQTAARDMVERLEQIRELNLAALE
ncbi:M23 family metallopeptidase, partial [Hydrogenophaga sp.]|uniref:M23 family metallopeptidase n=1 Tax=Hydrogenophaga sp. TaxID=1904254 RepID=UPI0026082514